MLTKAEANQIKAMDIVVRDIIGDEDITMMWLMGGVPDGDIRIDTTTEEIQQMYDKDDLKQFTKCFNHCMKQDVLDNKIH